MLQDDMNMPVDDAPQDEGDGAPRQSYNFAPGYLGVVYRADRSLQPNFHQELQQDQGRGRRNDDSQPRPGYRLQSMQWGIIPSWTKRKPDYSSMLKTINCRDDSLANPGGLWASMKGSKRCIVLAQGFYEWLQKAPKDKIPHFVKRKDGKLLCMAGLWDCVTYEGDDTPHFTFTVITTSSNRQLKFLHHRMPVILEPGSNELRMWLDPERNEWSRDLQALLKPFPGEFDIYPVSKDVGKVGNDSPSFVIPISSKENKNNIANFFSKGGAVKQEKKEQAPSTSPLAGTKREAPAPGCVEEEGPLKKMAVAPAATALPSKPAQRPNISATRNPARSPAKLKSSAAGSQKITKFFK